LGIGEADDNKAEKQNSKEAFHSSLSKQMDVVLRVEPGVLDGSLPVFC
jgi:hypothetical protein